MRTRQYPPEARTVKRLHYRGPRHCHCQHCCRISARWHLASRTRRAVICLPHPYGLCAEAQTSHISARSERTAMHMKLFLENDDIFSCQPRAMLDDGRKRTVSPTPGAVVRRGRVSSYSLQNPTAHLPYHRTRTDNDGHEAIYHAFSEHGWRLGSESLP